MKLWDKGGKTEKLVLEFTTARDRSADAKLAEWDIAASMAHCIMLHDARLLSDDDKSSLVKALLMLFNKAAAGEMVPGDDYEDIHSMVEDQLVMITGEAGMRLHAGRSRNDQVATDINLFLKYEISRLASASLQLLESLIVMGECHRDVMIPGYTHLQPAMPSTWGLWFGSYAESLCDDTEALGYAVMVSDISPAGTAAGYGTTLPVRREVAAGLLGFSRLVITSPYAQMRRGRSEKAAADAMASVAHTLGRFAGEVCLYLTGEFGFLELKESYSTGSSIMPQKKNPDVFEIIRARANVLRALPNTIALMTTNLPGGYNRDYQVLKEVLFPAVEEMHQLIEITSAMLDGLKVRSPVTGESYNSIFSADEANRSVMEKGIPFRKAYRSVAKAGGKQKYRQTFLEEYTHLGSPGNPGLDIIRERASVVAGRIMARDPRDIVAAIAGSSLSGQ